MKPAPEPGPTRAFRVSQIARSTGIPKSSIYALIRSGELPAVRFSASGLVILETDLLDFLQKRRTTAGGGR